MAAPYAWSFTTAAPTIVIPTATGQTPAANATSVVTTVAPTVTFNESVVASSIGFTLKNPAGTAVTATLAYNDTTHIATLTPATALTASTVYTATVSGVKDAAGNTMAAPYAWSFTTAGTTIASTEPLITQSNIQYIGAFRVPDGTIGASSFSYGGSAITYNPANKSLFAVGMPYDQAIAEITIPTTIVNSSNLNDLAVSTVIQPFSSILPRIPNNPSNIYSNGGYEAIGGLMVNNGQLIGTAYNTYDAPGLVSLSHFTLSSTTLASASVSGLYQVGSMGGGFVGGYMMPVPAEWRASLGAPFITGQAALNVISRTSYGPDAFGFDPAQFGSTMTPDIPYLYYDQNHTTLGGWSSSQPTQFNSTVGGFDLTGMGAIFVPGSRSVIYFGAMGTGNFYYGEAAAANDPNRIWKGPHSVGGNYVWQAWAYDASDLVAVKNGQKNPWDVVPYATWNFNLPTSDGAKEFGGATFDPVSGRLYLSEMNVDNSRSQYDNCPIIQVFQIGLPQTNAITTNSLVTTMATPLPATTSTLGGITTVTPLLMSTASVTKAPTVSITSSASSTIEGYVPLMTGTQGLETNVTVTATHATKIMKQQLHPKTTHAPRSHPTVTIRLAHDPVAAIVHGTLSPAHPRSVWNRFLGLIPKHHVTPKGTVLETF